MKTNVLVPMAGLGSRFQKAGYNIPKQLIFCYDRQLIDISLDCLDYSNCNLIFVVRDDQVFNHKIDKILKQKFGDDIKVVVLDKLTDGSVASCLAASEFIENSSPLLIHTLDVEFSPKISVSELDLSSTDGIIYTFKSNSPNYSYVQMDSSGRITKTAEKKVISDRACVGIYVFRSGLTFCSYARKMIQKDIRTNGEFYITPLYNLLIEDGLVVKESPVEKMHVFGTPEEFDFYKNNVCKRLGDRPIALCSDHSGFSAKESFKEILSDLGLNYIDFGTFVDEDCDYNTFIDQAAKSIMNRECDYGFGFCRTGQGVNICANKQKGIRSALIYNEFAMEMAIRHNCANFFAIPQMNIDKSSLYAYIKMLSEHTFDGGRHQMRIQNLEK